MKQHPVNKSCSLKHWEHSQPPHEQSILVSSSPSSSHKCFPHSMDSGVCPSEQPFLTLFSAAHLTMCPDELLSKRLLRFYITVSKHSQKMFTSLLILWFCLTHSEHCHWYVLKTRACCVDSDLRMPGDCSWGFPECSSGFLSDIHKRLLPRRQSNHPPLLIFPADLVVWMPPVFCFMVATFLSLMS